MTENRSKQIFIGKEYGSKCFGIDQGNEISTLSFRAHRERDKTGTVRIFKQPQC